MSGIWSWLIWALCKPAFKNLARDGIFLGDQREWTLSKPSQVSGRIHFLVTIGLMDALAKTTRKLTLARFVCNKIIMEVTSISFAYAISWKQVAGIVYVP